MTTSPKIWPLIPEGQSDSACFDNTSNCGRRRLLDAHAMMMPSRGMVGQPLMDPDRRAFYEYHAALMEPVGQDRPPSLSPIAPDRRHAGSQRPRPARYLVTDDDLVVMGSEMGVLQIPGTRSSRSGACSRARDVPDRHGTGPHHRRRRTPEASFDHGPPTRIGWTRRRSDLFDLPSVVGAMSPIPTPCSTVSRRLAIRRKTWFLLTPMVLTGRERNRLDGGQPACRAFRQAEAAGELFPAAVRPGHQPADRARSAKRS